MVGLGLIVALLLVSALAPLLAPHPRDTPQLAARFVAPFSHDVTGSFRLLGTDHLGRDHLTRLLYATRISLGTALLAQLAASALGLLLGLWAGYHGGWSDALISRTLELVASLPALPILLILATLAVQQGALLPLPAGVTALTSWALAVNEREARTICLVIAALAGLSWTNTARLMRGEVLALRERGYVEAARALGFSNRRIMARHILPNTLPLMLVDLTLGVNAMLVAESALSFVGLGIQDPTPTWGNMLNVAESYMFQYPWMPLVPSLPILLASLAINYVGDGLRDALDPHQHP